jgi:hypothetical protein
MILFRTCLIITLLIGILVLRYLKKRGLRSFLSLLLILPILLQNLLLIIYSFLNETIQVLGNNIFQPVLENSCLNIFLAILSCYFGIFISNLNFKTLKPDNFSEFNYNILFKSKYLKFLLCLASISWFVQMFFNQILVIPIISSFFIFFSQILFIGPAFAGFYRNKYKLPSQLFFLTWIISIPNSFSTGDRGFLFLPIGLFILGFFSASQWKMKRKIIFISFFIFPIVILISAGIEAVRYNIRFSTGNDLIGMYRLISSYLTSFDFSYINEVLSIGLARLIQWSNFVAPAVVSTIQPFKYFDNFLTEITFIFSSFNPLESDNQTRAIQIVESGMFYGSAKYIGYEVVHGYTVPYPGIAEGWVRFGFIGVFFYYYIFCKLLVLYYSYFKKLFRSPRILYFSIILASTLVGFKSYEYQIAFLLKVLLQVFIIANFISVLYISLLRKNK